MADEEAPKEVKRDPDDILKDWFKARVVSSFKCKPEAADALVNNEASRVAVETFLNNETSQRLLVFSNPDLMAALNPPEKFRKKTLCFLKLTETELSPDNVDQTVIYGDFGDVPLEHLSVLANEVFLPMITNPATRSGGRR